MKCDFKSCVSRVPFQVTQCPLERTFLGNLATFWFCYFRAGSGIARDDCFVFLARGTWEFRACIQVRGCMVFLGTILCGGKLRLKYLLQPGRGLMAEHLPGRSEGLCSSLPRTEENDEEAHGGGPWFMRPYTSSPNRGCSRTSPRPNESSLKKPEVAA